MAVKEKDPVTGRETTGHEWNGIKELDTPIPRIVIFFLVATTLFSIVYWILMPAWPLGVTYTRGLLGIDQRDTVAQSLGKSASERANWANQILTLDFSDIEKQPELMQIVDESGRTLFGDNCAVCHGLEGKGNPGYPNLTAGAWLWGGDPETIEQTLLVGINSDHPDTRFGQMPAFGKDGIIPRDDIRAVVSYLRSNAQGVGPLSELDAENVDRGAEVFAENCAACHGENGAGDPTVGAPNLMDANWIVGSDRQALIRTISQGRQGHMPHWSERLSPMERKILALYVSKLGEQSAVANKGRE